MKTKRWRKGLLLLVVMVLIAGACAGIGLKRGGKDLPEIRVGEYGYEPYSDLSTTPSPAAIDVAIAEEAFRRMGYQAVFCRVDGEDADKLLDNGTIDCLWNASEMKKDRASYQWAGPYLYACQIVVVRTDSGIGSLAELAGKRVAVRAGSDTERLLLERTNPEVPELGSLYAFSTGTQVRTSLSKGYSDAIAGYVGELNELLNNSPDEFRILDQELDEKPLEAAFPAECDPALVEQMQETLAEMQEDGTIQEIVKTYDENGQKTLKGER